MLAELIKAFRHRDAVTQEELAERTGLSVRNIGKLERGQTHRPRPATVRLLADAFGLTGAEREQFMRAAARQGEPPTLRGSAPEPASPAAPPADQHRQSPADRPRQLPAPPLLFTGRQGELTALDRLPGGETVAVVGIDGMPGVGKTALALRWAHQVAHRFPDGQFFLDLRGFSDPAAPVEPLEALDRMLRAWGVPGGWIPAELDDRAALWRTTLAGRRVLLVLDNAASHEQVVPLLPGAPQSLALVTSRRRLVDLDSSLSLSLETLPAVDAARLFTLTAGADRVAGEPPAAIDEIVELCERLPLAIRIAAARLRSHPSWALADLARRLGEWREQHPEPGRTGSGGGQPVRLPGASTGAGPAVATAVLDEGAHSVGAALDLSYHQLTPVQRRVYRLLSLHPGLDFDPYIAAAVSELSLTRARQRLDQLFEAHLLQEPAPTRFTFHGLIHRHAATAAARDEPVLERRAAVRRVLDYFRYTTALAMDVAYPYQRASRPVVPPASSPVPELPDPSSALAWLDFQLANLLAVAGYAAQHGSPEHAVQLGGLLPLHLHTRGRYGDLTTLYQWARTSAQSLGDRPGEAAALNGLGWAQWLQGHFEPALGWFARAMEIATAVGHQDGVTGALIGLGWGHQKSGRYAQAAQRFQEALAAARRAEDSRRQFEALQGLGWGEWLQQRYPQCLTRFRRCLALARATGDQDGELDALLAIGNGHRMLEQHRPAQESFEQVLEVARALRHRHGETHALLGLGHLHQVYGEHGRAVECYRQALIIARDTGQGEAELHALTGLGHSYRVLDRAEAARLHWQEALRVFSALGVEALPGEPNTARSLRELLRSVPPA